jgi:alpha-methylacyl-CoA racemase
MTHSALLDGVRVIDLSQYIPGPFATRQFADLGAEVIKIEPPGGDPMRRFMHRDPAQPSAVYRHLNRGKRIAELDLKSDSGRAALRALVEGADILLESYRPGVLARLGFDRKRLDALNPQLIHCALSGYGQTGPYAQRPGHDISYCALSSQAIASGTYERPVIGFPPIADHAAALQAAVAMLAALHARDKRQSGIFLDISLTESILAWQYLPLLADAGERATSLLDGGAAFYNLYACADGAFISLGAIETGFWRNFCNAVARPQWIDRHYESMPQRALIAEVAELIGSQPLGHWQQVLDQADCCFEILLDTSALGLHPQMQARQALTAAGPTYPGWIDHRPVELADDFEMIDSGEPPGWRRPG